MLKVMKYAKKKGYWRISLFLIIVLGILGVVIGNHMYGWNLLNDHSSSVAETERPQALENPYQVTLNGREIALRDPAYLIGGTVMLPMRDVLETEGYRVVFHPYQERAVASSEEQTVTVKIGQQHGLISNEAYRMERPAVVIEGSMYLPLDFVEHALQPEALTRT